MNIGDRVKVKEVGKGTILDVSSWIKLGLPHDHGRCYRVQLDHDPNFPRWFDYSEVTLLAEEKCSFCNNGECPECGGTKT